AHADGHALDHAGVAARARRDLHPEALALDARGLAGGDAAGVAEPRALAARDAEAPPRPDAEGPGELCGALSEAPHAVLEHVAPRVGRKLRHRLERSTRRRDGPLDRGAIREGHARRDLSRVLVADLEIPVGCDRLIRDVVGIALA